MRLGQQYVRVGLLGGVGRFAAADSQRYPRGARVVCRTGRGLAVGEVLAPLDAERGGPADGTLLRRVTIEDDLLLARLEKNRDEAYRACSQRLVERGIGAVLVDVEHLFDGQSLYFYVLGETTPELDALPAELAELYEAQVVPQVYRHSHRRLRPRLRHGRRRERLRQRRVQHMRGGRSVRK
jgi:hypothetical protein